MNGSMTEDITYDDLYARYENSKYLLKEIRSTFTSGFQNIQNVIQSHESQQNAALIGALSSILNTTKTTLGTLFAQSTDPGLFKPSKLEQQIISYQNEKQQGLQMVQGLQSTIASLQAEKRNWEIREQKGKKLIEQYQVQLSNSKNGTYINPQTESNPAPSTHFDENTNVVQELTDELELAQTNAGHMRQMVDALSQQNKSLSHQVLTLREQKQIIQRNKQQNGTYNTTSLHSASNVEALKQQVSALTADKERLVDELATYKKRLSASGNSLKQLYRNDTQTEWKEEDLAGLREEMVKEMKIHHQEELEKMFEKQFALRMPTVDPDNDGTEKEKEKEKENDNDNDNDNGDNGDREEKKDDLMRPPSYDRAFRDGTKTEWDQMQLDSLKDTMKEEMGKMATLEKQRLLQAMAERNDAIRDPTDASTLQLIVPHGYGDVGDSASDEEDKAQREKDEMKRQMQQMVYAEKQKNILSMSQRNEEIRDESTNINVKKDQEQKEQDTEDMMKEYDRIKKENLASQFDKNYRLVTESNKDVSQKILVTDMDDAKAMEKQMIALNKQAIYRKTETFLNTAEPQIKPKDKDNFMDLMQNIGILNENKVKSLWDNIEETVYGDKRKDIQLRAHSITASQTYSDSGDTVYEENGNGDDAFKKELEIQKQLEEAQKQLISERESVTVLREEIEQMKEQQQLAEDDLDILGSDHQTPGQHLTPGGPQSVVALESDINIEKLNDEMDVLKVENMSLKETNDDINKRMDLMKGQMNEEIERIAKSKIELLKNTSKEIDALRKLLSDYVTLANQIRNKRK